MARETKAQKQARMQHEADQLRMKQVSEYSARLMSALEESAKFNFELTVKDGKFVVVDRDRSRANWTTDAVELTMDWSDETQMQLENLEFRVGMKAMVAAEAERVRLLKQNALNKLTKEEREALGL